VMRSSVRPWKVFPILLLSALIPAFILSFASIVFNFIPFYFVAILLGSVFIFTVINSINYQDGIDGLAGGEVFISLLGFVIISLITGNNFALTLAMITTGAVFAFLFFNLHPAKIFMGDSGAYSLGFI
ncbi:MAG: undecaprenyl/decaprenyl-phosphate alpha-N-acetylglucosaminyl 1-phosphate transferase, partial [Patescibacteria group bacterium]